MMFEEFVSELDGENQDDFLSRDLSVLHFFSDWQMNCLMTLPILESLAEEFSDKIFFGKVNVEEQDDLAEKFNIKKVPTLLVFKHGKQVDRIENCSCEETLRERISCFL